MKWDLWWVGVVAASGEGTHTMRGATAGHSLILVLKHLFNCFILVIYVFSRAILQLNKPSTTAEFVPHARQIIKTRDDF